MGSFNFVSEIQQEKLCDLNSLEVVELWLNRKENQWEMLRKSNRWSLWCDYYTKEHWKKHNFVQAKDRIIRKSDKNQSAESIKIARAVKSPQYTKITVAPAASTSTRIHMSQRKQHLPLSLRITQHVGMTQSMHYTLRELICIYQIISWGKSACGSGVSLYSTNKLKELIRL